MMTPTPARLLSQYGRQAGIVCFGEFIAILLFVTTPPPRPIISTLIAAHVQAHIIIALGAYALTLGRNLRKIRSG